MRMVKVALFDFDGTIYPYETFDVLMDRLKHHPEFKSLYKKFIIKFAPVYFLYKLKLIPKIKMQSKAMELYMLSFKGYSRDKIEKFFHDVADSMDSHLRQPLIEKIRELKKDNYYVMLISGAFVPLLKALFKEPLFDHIVGTEVRYNGDIYDYKSGVQRVHADGKVDVIKQHLYDKVVDWKDSRAYSDSYSDLKMLKLVGNPVAVAPDAPLLVAANQNNWEVYMDNY
jgi:HAD superfamily hydrolase (TIGR01490 family)